MNASLELASPRNWFKGADTTIVLKWPHSKILEVCVDHPESDYLNQIYACLERSNAFFSLLYRLKLWLSKRESRAARTAGLEMLAAYKHCAGFALQLGVPRFKLQPKLHFAMHIVMSHKETNRATVEKSKNTKARNNF